MSRQREGDITDLCFRINSRLFRSVEQKLTRIGAGAVFELCSAGGYLGIEVLGGRELNASEGGMQQKELEISRRKANRGLLDSPSLGWRSLASLGCLGQIRDAREWAPCSMCKP